MSFLTEFDDDDPRIGKHNARVITQRPKPKRKPKIRPKRRRRRRGRPRGRKKFIRKETRERRAALAKFRTPSLYAELARRSNAARMAKMTPELRRQVRENAKARFELARSLCRHDRQPKQRRSDRGKGRGIGTWYCPKCFKTMPAPRLDQEGLEIVV